MERRTREQWATLVDEHQASGQSLAAFSRRRGIEARTLQWWRWKLGRGRRAQGRRTRRSGRGAGAIRLVPIDVVGSAGTADAGSDAPIAIELAGVTLRIATGTSLEYVAKLVAMLRTGC